MRDELADLRVSHDRLRGEVLILNYELKFSKLMRALKALTAGDHFNPEQPRDWHGRWTVADNTVAANAASREAECEAQYARDTFICNSLKLRSCWESAFQRYAACLRGHAIPALRF